MVLKRLQNGSFVVSCMGYPQCKHSRFFDNLAAARVTDETCLRCGPDGSVKKLEFTFARGAAPGFPPVFVGCYACDAALADVVISDRCVPRPWGT
jgi:DNA topoisomerase-3